TFDVLAERTRADLLVQWLAAQAAGLVGCGGGSDVGGMVGTLAGRLGISPVGFLSLRDQGPAEALLLAVRAARRALAVNPDDAGAYLLLGEAYLRLARQTREQGWRTFLPVLADIRRVQALTALEQAVLLRPDLD